MIRVSKKDDQEALENLLRRFKRVVQNEGGLAQYRKRQYYQKPPNRKQRREEALKRKRREEARRKRVWLGQ